MPLQENNVRDVQHRVMMMYMDTIKTFRILHENADLFGADGVLIREAIKEYLNDFIDNPNLSGVPHPEESIYKATRIDFQKIGMYGRQLDLKESQVQRTNNDLRESFGNRARNFIRKRFKKWIGVTNNFLGSIVSIVPAAEALKELKDCLYSELPDEL